MNHKIKFTARNWSDLCNFYSKVNFRNFCFRNFSLLFFAELELLMSYNNIVKISEKWNKGNLLKVCLQVTYPTDICIICIHFFSAKKGKYWIFLKPMTRIENFLCIGSYDKRFGIKS